jgi:hypothetical protein
MSQIIISLTPKQIAAIKPAMDRIQGLSDRGMFGMCLAQVFHDHMKVGVMDPEPALRILKALGVETPKLQSSAYDEAIPWTGPRNEPENAQ